METQEIGNMPPCIDGDDDRIGTLIIPKYDEGHAETKWNKNDPKDVEIARQAFIKHKALGYTAYRVDPKSGDKGEIMKEFDPNAGQIIMMPAFAGG